MKVTRKVANGEITTIVNIGRLEMFFTRPTTLSRIARHLVPVEGINTRVNTER